MHDRPTVAELIDAVRRFLEAGVLPTITDARLRFQALVAANVLAIVGRELAVEEGHLRPELLFLRELVALPQEPASLADLRRLVREGNAMLCQRIRSGEFDDPGRLADLARRMLPFVVRKLEVANPRYLADMAKKPRPG
jgi:hypothetical protein